MTITDIQDSCIAKLPNDEYKEFVFKFFDTIEKKYGIKFKMTYRIINGTKFIWLCVLPKNCKIYDHVRPIAVKHKIVGHWEDIFMSWHRIFNKLFKNDNSHRKCFMFGCYLGDAWYTTPRYKTFEEFKIAVDMDMVTLDAE